MIHDICSCNKKNRQNIINKKTTVVVIASELNISRQTIHKWLSRYKRFGMNGLYCSKENKTPYTKKKLFSHQTAGQELQMDTTYPYGYKQEKVIYTITFLDSKNTHGLWNEIC